MNIRPFEIALIGFFILSGIVGIVVLSNFKPEESENQKLYGENISMWGTMSSSVMNKILADLSQENKALLVVKYKEVDSRTFNDELLNAIADGRSPDIVIMPHDYLVTYRSKLQPISFDTISERAFSETYIDGADIFKRGDGIYGIPFAVDPLVMYWNKDIFSSSGLAQPPKTWEALLSTTASAIVRTNEDLEITQSAVAFGEYSNVAHAKEILSMLFLQAGSSIVDEKEGNYAVTLNRNSENGLPPGEAALTFYTQFVIPGREYYSWNRSKGLDTREFLNGSLALYFALGSERKNLERDNPNLSFDTAPVPQGEGVAVARNYGRIYAFSIPRASKNIQGAYAVATYLADAKNAEMITDAYNFAPVHRSLYIGGISGVHKNVVYQSALVSRGWLDPKPEESVLLFQKMVEDVTSGKVRLKSIMVDTVRELESLF